MASLRNVASFSFLSVFLPFVTAPLGAQASKPAAPDHTYRRETLPLVFERNEGQLPAGVGFLGRTQHYSVAVGAKELRFSLPGAHRTSSVTLSFEGGGAAAPTGVTESPLLTNYYMGSDPKGYRTGIKNYSRIGLSHVYPGIDAQFYASGETIEHDFYVAPGADASAISMNLAGAEKASLNSQGEVLIPAESGELRLKKPVAFQIDPQGKHIEVAAAFVLDKSSASRGLRFQLGDYDHTRELVIDPVILYATYFGGLAGSTAAGVASDPSGNVYLTGYTTSSVADFGVTSPAPNSYTGTPGPMTSVFVARFNAADAGSKVGWLTFLGSSTGVSQSTSIALQQGAAPGIVYVGGLTNAIDFPTTGGAFQTAPAIGMVNRGFVAALATTDGTRSAATYLDSDPSFHTGTTAVNALTTDSAGNVVAVGAASGPNLPVSTEAGRPLYTDTLTLASSALKGFILQFKPTLTPDFIYGTYLMGNVPGADTSLTGVTTSVDSNGNLDIYVGGYTLGNFPQAGLYSATTVMNAHNPTPAASSTDFDSFVAEIYPAPVAVAPATQNSSTIIYSAWLSGSGSDKLNAIAIDPLVPSSNKVFLFGQTTSTDLPANTTYTYSGTDPITTPTVGQTGAAPVSAPITKTGSATTSGFVTTLDATGQPLVVTYLGSATGDDYITSGAADAAGKVYPSGYTTSALQTTYSVPALPTGQDRSAAGEQHGFLAQLPFALSSVGYVANVGGSTGPDSVVSVSLDSSANAYVAANIAALSLPYTSLSAYQTANTQNSAYLAEITSAPTVANLQLAAVLVNGQATGNPNPVSYIASSPMSVKYSWTLTGQTTIPTSGVLLEIPVQAGLTYNTITITDTTNANTVLPSSACRNTPSRGISCVIPTANPVTPNTADSFLIELNTTVSSAPPAATITVTATVSDAASDTASVFETSTVQQAGNLSVTSAYVSPASNTVFTTATGASSPNTQVTSTFTLTNDPAAGDVTGVTFALTTPTDPASSIVISSLTSDGGGTCTPASCTGLHLAPGASIHFTVVWTYPDSDIPAGTASVVRSGAVTGTATSVGGFTNTATGSISPAITLQRGVHLAVTAGLSAPPNGQTVFNLGDSMTYTVSVANSGPSATSGTDTLTVTLPAAFTFTAVNGFTCTGASPNVCTLAIPVTAAGATAGPYTFTGSFADNASNAGFNGTPTPESFSAAAALSNDIESATTGTGYSSSSSTSVQRTSNVVIFASTLTVPTAPACAGGGTSCVFIQNTADISDRIPYTFTINNNGPNVATNAVITIPLPSAPQNPAGTTHPFTVNQAAPPTIVQPGFGNKLTCTFSTSPNQIVCNAGNLAVGATALSFTGYLTADVNTVPATSTFVTAPSPGSVTTAATANGATVTGTALPAIEIDRVSHLVTTKVVSLSGTASTPGSPINLDENSPSLSPGKNDTVSVTVSVGNMPLDAAPNVVLTDTLPPYFRLIQVPGASANCKVGGVALTTNYTTGATPVTLTCTLGTLAPGAATRSVGSTAATVGAGAITFSYAGKFVDNATNADITGATLTAKVSSLPVSLSTAAAVASFTFDPYASDATSAAPSAITVIRAAHLVTLKTVVPTGTTPSLPIDLDENKPSVSAGVNDTVTATIKVGNNPSNNAIAVNLADTLPPYFRVTQLSASASSCTVQVTGSPAVALAVNYATAGTAAQVSCSLGTVPPGTATPSAGVTPATVASPSFTLTYSGKFLDNGVSPDGTGTLPTKTSQFNALFATSASTSAYTVDPIAPSDATSAATTVAVQRLVHLILRKSRNTTVAAAPSTFADTTDANLDEKTTTTKFGVNDEVEYDIALANGGRNMALGVQFTDVLPPYFTLVSAYAVSGSAVNPDTGANGVPANQLTNGSVVCFQGATATGTALPIPFSTSGSSMKITCTYGSATTPLSLAAGPSTAGNLDNATTIQFVYQGKFQDNAPAADDIGAGVSTFTVTSTAGDAIGSDLYGVDTFTDSTSAKLANYTIQRAAHLVVLNPTAMPVPTTITGTALTIINDPTTGLPVSITGQAEPGYQGAPDAFNCLRYKIYLQNSGPNIARQPQFSLTLPNGLVATSSVIGATTTPGATDPALTSNGCAYSLTPTTISTSVVDTTTVVVPLTEQANATVAFDIDGYFKLQTLNSVNYQAGYTVGYSNLTDLGIKDSGKAPAFTPVTSQPVSVVNTPSGSKFTVKPYSTAVPATQPTSISFGTVSAPGVTTLMISADGPALPAGPSPNPPDNKKTINLYRTGTGTVNYYKLASSAVTAPGTNPTALCFASPSAATLSDTFAKPERVLLWALSGLPSGSPVNAVPNVASPYTGDITTSVVASGATRYLEAGDPLTNPYTTFSTFPKTQSQPAQVCGQVNGFAPVATPLVTAVLEPVNFAPIISPNTATAVQPPGKGVSETTFLLPDTTDRHDYNDKDPCYRDGFNLGSPSSTATRPVCDDNLVLTTWIYGGENLIPSQSHVLGPLGPTEAASLLNSTTPFEASGASTFYELVADQLAVPVFIAKQCDPSSTTGNCPLNTAGLSGTPPQEQLSFTTAQIAQLVTTGGGSSGLIVLPAATDPTVANTGILGNLAMASGTVTAGQTIGFQWILSNLTQIQPNTTYSLACYRVTSATDSTVIPMPAGLSCNVAPTIYFPLDFDPTKTKSDYPANPAIYVVTTGSLGAQNSAPSGFPAWKAIGGGVLAALVIPCMLFRRRTAYPKRFGLLVLLLLLAGAAGISGCGTGGVAVSAITQTPPSGATPYLFRVSATPATGVKVVSTAFAVTVVAGN